MCSLCECTHVCTNTGCRFYGPPDSGRVIARGTRVKTKSGPQPRGTLRPCACYRKRVRKSRKVKQQCTKTPIKYYYLRPPPPPPPRFCGQKRFWRREHHTRRTKKKKKPFSRRCGQSEFTAVAVARRVVSVRYERPTLCRPRRGKRAIMNNGRLIWFFGLIVVVITKRDNAPSAGRSRPPGFRIRRARVATASAMSEIGCRENPRWTS